MNISAEAKAENRSAVHEGNASLGNASMPWNVSEQLLFEGNASERGGNATSPDDSNQSQDILDMNFSVATTNIANDTEGNESGEDWNGSMSQEEAGTSGT